MNKFFNYFLFPIIILLIISFVLDIVFVTEIEQYSMGMEITHAEQSTQYNYQYNYTLKNTIPIPKTVRTFYLRGDDITYTLNVDNNTFALYKQGDWVEVEFTIYESFILHRDITSARILGGLYCSGIMKKQKINTLTSVNFF